MNGYPATLLLTADGHVTENDRASLPAYPMLVLFLMLVMTLQVSHAESMIAFFLALALYLLLERRYNLPFPMVAIMSLIRPSAFAFALALVLHLC